MKASLAAKTKKGEASLPQRSEDSSTMKGQLLRFDKQQSSYDDERVMAKGTNVNLNDNEC